MMATVLWGLEDHAEAAGNVEFADVAADAWYSAPVTWAASNGIVSGTGDGFSPNQSITREQMAVMLYAYASTKGYDLSVSADLSGYADADATSSWAATAMSWAVTHGLIGGKPGNQLDAGGTATRAEVAQILMNFCNVVAE
jgi:hypothetical protein